MSLSGGVVRHRFSGRPGAIWWALSIVMGLFFLILAAQVGRDGALRQLDSQLASSLSVSIPPLWLWFLSCFTYLGNRDFLAGVAVTLTATLLLRREWRVAIVCIVVTGGGGLLTTVMKHTFQRMRPEHVHGYVYETGWSFPSGHAAASMAVYGFACYLILRVLPARWHRLCLVAVVILICAIAVSRVLLQVHYLSDVMAGIALSLSWLSLWLGVLTTTKK